jgi:hypothetical protein
MKNVFKYSLVALLAFGACKSNAKKEEIFEDKLMKCTYNSFEDKGNAMKQLIEDYENQLIRENVLLSKEGASYLALYKIIGRGEDFINYPSKSFLTYVKEMGVKKNLKGLQLCEQVAYQDEALYNKSTLKKLQAIRKEMTQQVDLSPQWVASRMLTVFEPSDFDHDYYKLKAFLLFDTFTEAKK